MRTLNAYVTKELLIIFTAAIGILTFGMIGGNLLQVFQMVSRGIPLSSAAKFALYIAPMALSYTIPWGILVAVLLLFGRMSANNEITAMRACGISIFQIISPLVVLTFILTFLCIYLQSYSAPYYLARARSLTENVAINNPTALIAPGIPFEFGNMVIYVKNKESNNRIKDVQIFTFDKSKKNVDQDITAGRGEIRVDKKTGMLDIVLFNYNIIDYTGSVNGSRVFGKEFIISIDTAKEMNREPLSEKVGYMTFDQLMGRISLYRKIGLDPTPLEVQLNMNVAMGLSPIAFLLLGLPLAIRTSRKETSVGLFVSVILAGFYFFFLIGCNTLNDYSNIYPQYLLWAPQIFYQIFGFYFIYRISKK